MNLWTSALSHRCLAMKGLNEAMSKTSPLPGEYDVILAACYALAFQSTCMGDGHADFLTLIRGCGLVTKRILSDNIDTAFLLTENVRFLEAHLHDLPVLCGKLIEDGFPSLDNIRPLLQCGTEVQFHRDLWNVLASLERSPKQAYISFTCIFRTFYCTSHADFQRFIDPNNPVGQILLAHLIALNILFVPLTLRGMIPRFLPFPRLVLAPLDWAEHLYKSLHISKRHYICWPMRVANEFRADIDRNERHGEGILVQASRQGSPRILLGP